MFPFSVKIVEANGISMVLCPSERVLREYWQQFAEDSGYQVYMAESESARPLVVTRHGQRVVGAIFRAKAGGALVALPWIDFYRDEFLASTADDNNDADGEANGEESPAWTPMALEWGRRYVGALESLDAVIRQGREATLVPAWAQADGFRTKQEAVLSERLLQIQSKMSDLEKSRREVEEGLENLKSIYLRICLVMRWRNQRKGCCSGTRLTRPSDRADTHFTAKCMSAAKRNGTAMVRTCSLFEVARALADEPNEKFAASCRKTIIETAGGELSFPA